MLNQGTKTVPADQRDPLATDEYLTVEEVAAMLKLAPKTVQNKISAGVFKRGVHYFKSEIVGVRFKRSAIVASIEQPAHERTHDHGIPMAKGYTLGR